MGPLAPLLPTAPGPDCLVVVQAPRLRPAAETMARASAARPLVVTRFMRVLLMLAEQGVGCGGSRPWDARPRAEPLGTTAVTVRPEGPCKCRSAASPKKWLAQTVARAVAGGGPCHGEPRPASPAVGRR